MKREKNMKLFFSFQLHEKPCCCGERNKKTENKEHQFSLTFIQTSDINLISIFHIEQFLRNNLIIPFNRINFFSFLSSQEKSHEKLFDNFRPMLRNYSID